MKQAMDLEQIKKRLEGWSNGVNYPISDDCAALISEVERLTSELEKARADQRGRELKYGMALIHYLNDSFVWCREDETTPKTYSEILADFNASQEKSS